uniref:EF-hand domain-containing protein n=1 Tax=Leptocylindrus danicus TaxID=163516 RepID=A0A7S2PCK6_9STRA|mmetsp:Transcript_29316/g.43035  ORF Transcript_29316/g.43035 Transcript_29316/m.43035 type:complete len:261 (+) Transcript_29316:118-900(+)|eukprot:CAMPEP_0116028898 /NCGR_PEP_ID=MMETSP0321-20121206/15751_1 /TAXON_ID=163516 /ORGANISM="Leptocylindrus danicus var. danicus, Strain B650" /LENGTH=260 /DNA_ID=CAMNT_0003503037 /DNA_START=89 /DNA_END=871 /DNA_ORIENTATION=-
MNFEPETNKSPLPQHDTLVIHKESGGLSATISRINSQLRDLYLQFETEGPPSYRVLAFLGGLLFIVSSVVHLIEDIISLNYSRLIISAYTGFFGIVICLLEGRDRVCPIRHQKSLLHWAKCLHYVWGRGLLYIFAGFLALSQGGSFDIFVGGFEIAVGVLALVVGKKAALKLAHLSRSVISETELLDKFNQADENNMGYLAVNEFENFLELYGLKDLDVHELAAAFSAVDHDDDGKISFIDLNSWFRQFQYDSEDTRASI